MKLRFNCNPTEYYVLILEPISTVIGKNTNVQHSETGH